MPNCQWFGTLEDHQSILQHVLEDGSFEVLPGYSDVGESMRAIRSLEGLIQLFTLADPIVHLMLMVRGSGPGPVIDRIAVTGIGAVTWRDRCSAMGCVTLTIHTPRKRSLFYSSTNTFSEVRLGAVDGQTSDAQGRVWDVRLVNRKSAALNRFIRRQAVAKLGAISILPGASHLWQDGWDLGPWSRSKTPNAVEML